MANLIVLTFGRREWLSGAQDFTLHSIRVSDPNRPSIKAIQLATCQVSGYSMDYLCGLSKARCIARPRQMAMHLAYELTGKSYPQIAKAFRRKDHTTVLHADRVMKARLAAGDPDTLELMQAIYRLVMPDFLKLY